MGWGERSSEFPQRERNEANSTAAPLKDTDDTGDRRNGFPVSHSVKYCEPLRVAFQRSDKIAENVPSVPSVRERKRRETPHSRTRSDWDASIEKATGLRGLRPAPLLLRPSLPSGRARMRRILADRPVSGRKRAAEMRRDANWRIL